MPIGLFLCFGPGLVVWLVTREKESGDKKPAEGN